MKLYKRTLLTVSVILASSSPFTFASISEQRQQAISNQPETQNSRNFYDRRSEGWYWYQDEQAEKKKKLEELKEKQRVLLLKKQEEEKSEQEENPTRETIVQEQKPIKVNIINPETGKLNETIVVQAQAPTAKPFSSQWLKEKMPQMLQSALDNPEDETGAPSKETHAYMIMQKLALDKAQNFSKAATTVTQLDPFLDENSRVPIDTAANMVFAQLNSENERQIIEYLTQNVGLWFVYDTSCSFCSAQYEYLKDFKKIHKFKIMNISMDGTRLPNMDKNEIIYPDRGQAKQLRLRITPSIVMLVPPNNFYVVSQGLMSTSALTNRILLAADRYNVLPKDMREKLDPYAKGVLTTEQIKQMQSIQADIDKDPTKIVDIINKAVGN